MSRSPRWYGIALFPLVVVTSLLSAFGTRTFLRTLTSEEPIVGFAIVSVVLSVVAFWGGILVGVIVLVSLIADIRALRRNGSWRPSRLWGLAGVAHLVGVVFSAMLVVSVPALSYYLYRRRTRSPGA
jgi:hypothetical protein